MAAILSEDALQRYSGQTLFAPIGVDGQAKLMQSKVAIVGAGALGTVLANHMVRAGVGYVRIIDRDYVEWSNLQRQMLYDESDALQMLPKAQAAAARLRAINHMVSIEAHVSDLNTLNAEELLSGVDVIMDASDNFSVRYLINDIAIQRNIPWIYGGAVGSRGVSFTIIPSETPCLECVFGELPVGGNRETCDTIGVIGPIIHMIASRQATEAFKLLVGEHVALDRKMWQLDVWTNQFSQIDLSQAKQDDCPCCALKSMKYANPANGMNWSQTLCGRNSVQIQPNNPIKLSLAEMANHWQALGRLEQNPFLLRLHLDNDLTLVLFTDGRLLVQGTDDLRLARSLYSRYVGD